MVRIGTVRVMAVENDAGNVDIVPDDSGPRVAHRMEEAMALRDSRQAAIRKHPFFEWLHDDCVAIEDRLKFAPMGAALSTGAG